MANDGYILVVILYWQKFFRSSSSNAFSSDSLLSSLSQSILYWQKFFLIFATIMVPHRSPTNRREQSHPHPSATFPSNAFPSDSLLFQSFPKQTEIASNPCDHKGPTSEPNYWQKLPLILVTIKQCLFLWLPSIPVSLSPPQMHLRGRIIKQCLSS